MCDLSEGIWERGVAEGRAEGLAEGLAEGRAGFLERAAEAVSHGLLSLRDAAAVFGFSEPEIAALL